MHHMLVTERYRSLILPGFEKENDLTLLVCMHWLSLLKPNPALASLSLHDMTLRHYRSLPLSLAPSLPLHFSIHLLPLVPSRCVSLYILTPFINLGLDLFNLSCLSHFLLSPLYPSVSERRQLALLTEHL